MLAASFRRNAITATTARQLKRCNTSGITSGTKPPTSWMEAVTIPEHKIPRFVLGGALVGGTVGFVAAVEVNTRTVVDKTAYYRRPYHTIAEDVVFIAGFMSLYSTMTCTLYTLLHPAVGVAMIALPLSFQLKDVVVDTLVEPLIKHVDELRHPSTTDE